MRRWGNGVAIVGEGEEDEREQEGKAGANVTMGDWKRGGREGRKGLTPKGGSLAG